MEMEIVRTSEGWAVVIADTNVFLPFADEVTAQMARQDLRDVFAAERERYARVAETAGRGHYMAGIIATAIRALR